jgi:hypothetical protein
LLLPSVILLLSWGFYFEMSVICSWVSSIAPDEGRSMSMWNGEWFINFWRQININGGGFV